MRNQIAAAERMGVRALTINSENKDPWRAVEAALTRDEADVLLISPERLANDRFREQVLAPAAARIALLVVDEAHCISDWGHDFRPHYRLLERIIQSLPRNLRLLATTATANNRVGEDLSRVHVQVFLDGQTQFYGFILVERDHQVHIARAEVHELQGRFPIVAINYMRDQHIWLRRRVRNGLDA